MLVQGSEKGNGQEYVCHLTACANPTVGDPSGNPYWGDVGGLVSSVCLQREGDTSLQMNLLEGEVELGPKDEGKHGMPEGPPNSQNK